MRWLVVTLMMIAPASAQTALERMEPRLRQAIEEHRVFLTCSSLDPQAHASIEAGWRQIVSKARAQLASRYTSLADLARFDQMTAETSLVRGDAPLREAIDLCTRTSADWHDRYVMFRFIFDIGGEPAGSK